MLCQNNKPKFSFKLLQVIKADKGTFILILPKTTVYNVHLNYLHTWVDEIIPPCLTHFNYLASEGSDTRTIGEAIRTMLLSLFYKGQFSCHKFVKPAPSRYFSILIYSVQSTFSTITVHLNLCYRHWPVEQYFNRTVLDF